MQFFGKLLDTVSSVSNLFANPYRVRDVPMSDYAGGGKIKLREEGRMMLYKNTQCRSWDCLLMCPEMPAATLRSVLLGYAHGRPKEQFSSILNHLFMLLVTSLAGHKIAAYKIFLF